MVLTITSERTKRHESLDRALDALDEDKREVFVLYEIEEAPSPPQIFRPSSSRPPGVLGTRDRDRHGPPRGCSADRARRRVGAPLQQYPLREDPSFRG